MNFHRGKNRIVIIVRLCMIVDWYLDYLKCKAKIKVISKINHHPNGIRIMRYRYVGKYIRLLGTLVLLGPNELKTIIIEKTERRIIPIM